MARPASNCHQYSKQSVGKVGAGLGQAPCLPLQVGTALYALYAGLWSLPMGGAIPGFGPSE